MDHVRTRTSLEGRLRARGTVASALLALVATGAPVQAAITPLSSQLTASSAADLDPVALDPVPDEDSDGTPDGQLQSPEVSTSQGDSLPPNLSELVTASASVIYTGNDLVTVSMSGSRSGTDDSLGAPGGYFASKANFDLAFQNLDVGSITVDWDVTFERPSMGTFTPFGIVVRRGGIVDSRGPEVPFDALSGSFSGSETFDLTETSNAFYDLELVFYLVRNTTNLLQLESWDATFTVSTPPMSITPVPEPSAPLATLAGVGT